MEFGDDEAENPPRRGPLPPEDRTWRHPSELGSTPAPTAAPKPDSPPAASTVAAAVAGAAVGAVAMLGALVASGALENGEPPPPAVERVETEPASDDQRALAQDALAAVVRLEHDSTGEPVAGTGLLIRDDGHILTTAQVVDGTDVVQAVFSDGRRLQGEVVGRDATTDLAVVKVPEPDSPGILIGSASDLQLGERVIAISAPSADDRAASVTQGVLSGKGLRVLQSPDPGGLHDLHGMLRVSASVGDPSPGSAVIDQAGALVGIITGRAGPARPATVGSSAQGPYATPIEYARWIGDLLIAEGEVQHAWLGIEGQDAPIAAGPGSSGGVTVTAVEPGGPAESAGMEPDDVITAFEHTPVESLDDLEAAIRWHQPGEKVTVEYRRSGSTRTCEPTLDERETPT